MRSAQVVLNLWTKRPLYAKIFICIIIGAFIGIYAKPFIPYIHPLGVIFIRLLKMLIVPLTFFSLVAGILSMGDIRSLRRIGVRILLMFAFTTVLSGLVGVSIGLFFNVGKEVQGAMAASGAAAGKVDFVENLITWFPTNIVEAMATANMLQIIFFSILFGVVLLMLGEEKADLVIKFFKQSSGVMIKMTNCVMTTAPYGIMALVADMTNTLGGKMLMEVGKFIAIEYLEMAIILIVIYPLILKLMGRIDPIRFFKNIAPAMLVAASTTSSAATLPVSMQCASEKLGLPEKIYGFGLPLGASICMNGLSVYYGIVAVFASNLYNIPITPMSLFQFVFLGLILTMGAAAVKGAAIVGTTVLLSTLGMPLTIMPIVAAINPIIDIGHTTLNVTGTLVSSTVTASRMGMMDHEIFKGTKSDESPL